MPKLIWVGAFPPDQSNAGDHAQTLAIEKFLSKNFHNHEIHQFYRDEVGKSKWDSTTYHLTPEDLIIINSSGDFGSRYAGWHDVRGQIAKRFQSIRIINLPTTVYYSDDQRGRVVLERDRGVYNSLNFTLLCREPVSERIASQNFNCDVQFFPDFVFVLLWSIELFLLYYYAIFSSCLVDSLERECVLVRACACMRVCVCVCVSV
jgi:exopolysaccharide biosynthesis predicted pyruvyltransferase EpsI